MSSTGPGQRLKLIHGPTGIRVGVESAIDLIHTATKDRLLAELRVLVENYEPIKPT